MLQGWKIEAVDVDGGELQENGTGQFGALLFDPKAVSSFPRVVTAKTAPYG
jgi:hypothetical protein